MQTFSHGWPLGRRKFDAKRRVLTHYVTQVAVDSAAATPMCFRVGLLSLGSPQLKVHNFKLVYRSFSRRLLLGEEVLVNFNELEPARNRDSHLVLDHQPGEVLTVNQNDPILRHVARELLGIG